MAHKRKKILFVDDDVNLLEILQQMMAKFSNNMWEVLTAPDVSRALGILQEHRADLLVIDIHMPVVDGLQFLNLLQRKYPNILKVVLTGDATDQNRATCLSSGAELFIEKPRDSGGWQSVYATLHELTRFQPEDGFHGVLRRVGLQDVLQMECLARNSSLLKISAGNVQGAIYVKDGQIIHAQCGHRTGEDAFNHLLGLSGGEFDVKPFSAPPAQSITGSWEFLLMEAARKRDEQGESPAPAALAEDSFPTPPIIPPLERNTPAVVPVIESPAPCAAEIPAASRHPQNDPEAGRPSVDEMLVCSLQGEVLHEFQCNNTNGRVGFLEFLSQKARQLAKGLPLGDFDRLEVTAADYRVVAQIQSDRGLFVRTGMVPDSDPENVFQP